MENWRPACRQAGLPLSYTRKYNNYSMHILLLSLLLLLFPNVTHAKYDPRTVPNNKYGIHVTDVNDIADTATLVNSSGGDWGYVTVVLQDNDQDQGKWQNIFNQMRRLHLIPIVRLATHPQGDFWVKPQAVDAQSRARFLNSLNWPIENRYVVLFNEPNHAKEWGNWINPEEYARIFVEYSTTLKSLSDDFFILPAGFDSSAPTSAQTLDMVEFINRMTQEKSEFFDLIDGWASHSYPNPGFSGLPTAYGKGTIRSYLWELSLVGKNLPVFITETGWINTPAGNLRLAGSTVWQDPNIVAITPFVFNYQSYPFEQFSWKKLGSDGFYPHYYEYQSIAKLAGAPKQRHSFLVGTSLLPDELVVSSHYNLEMTIKNTGQAIVGTNEGYTLELSGPFEATFGTVPSFEPGESVAHGVKLTTQKIAGVYPIKLEFVRGNERFLIEEKSVSLVPPPALALSLQLGWRITSSANDITVLVYDENTLVHKFTGLTIKNELVDVSGLTDIIPGNSYRIVTLVPYYLPRQTTKILTSETTPISFQRFLPLDFNNDGAFTVSDILSLLRNRPRDAIARFFTL